VEIGRSPLLLMASGARQAPPGRSGRRHRRHAHECCDADRNCADDGKDDLPRIGRHRVLHDPMGGVIAGERGRCDEDHRDREAQPERSHRGEHELADAERQRGGDKADDDPAGPACAGLISPIASGGAAKTGSANTPRVNRSQQRTPIAAMPARMPMKIMVAVSVRKGLTVAPSTTTTTTTAQKSRT